MYLLFFVFAVCAIVTIPIHFMSVEHTKLQKKFGEEKGIKVGEVYGRISGDLLFLSLIGLWLSPQPRFVLSFFQNPSFSVPVINFPIPLIHLIIFIVCAATGVWLLFQSVAGLTIKVSESHRPEKVITRGIYGRVRHPQYLGFLLTHIGFSFLLSGLFALIATPVIFLILYVFAHKEETELANDFGQDYKEYQKKVPMLVPRFGK